MPAKTKTKTKAVTLRIGGKTYDAVFSDVPKVAERVTGIGARIITLSCPDRETYEEWFARIAEAEADAADAGDTALADALYRDAQKFAPWGEVAA